MQYVFIWYRFRSAIGRIIHYLLLKNNDIDVHIQ